MRTAKVGFACATHVHLGGKIAPELEAMIERVALQHVLNLLPERAFDGLDAPC